MAKWGNPYEVIQYDDIYRKEVKRYPSIAEAARQNHTTVINIMIAVRSGRAWDGYYWEAHREKKEST